MDDPGVPVEPVADLVVLEERLRRLLFRAVHRGRGGARRPRGAINSQPGGPGGDLVVFEEGLRRLLFRAVPRGRGGRRERQGEQKDDEDAHYARRRKVQSLLPMKLSGMTRMIAIACAGIFSRPSVIRASRSTRLAARAHTATIRNRIPW